MKIITVCGSARFTKEMAEITEKMALQGHCMLTPITLTRGDKSAYTPEEIEILGQMHRDKIGMSDAILVVNVGGYIGDSTRDEIEYAKLLGKEILYYTDLSEQEEGRI